MPDSCGSSSRRGELDLRLRASMERIRPKTVVLSRKSGVAKSTLVQWIR